MDVWDAVEGGPFRTRSLRHRNSSDDCSAGLMARGLRWWIQQHCLQCTSPECKRVRTGSGGWGQKKVEEKKEESGARGHSNQLQAAVQTLQVQSQTHQGPFATHIRMTTHAELPETETFLDPPQHRLDNRLAQPIVTCDQSSSPCAGSHLPSPSYRRSPPGPVLPSLRPEPGERPPRTRCP